jgi:uncharacterized protein (DUF433 family)
LSAGGDRGERQRRRGGCWALCYTRVRLLVGKIMNPLLQRISIDPAICGGKPCIKGTRIWVSLILDFLAEGMSEAELLAEYPQLAHEDVLAAIAYGAEAARERVIPVTVG